MKRITAILPAEDLGSAGTRILNVDIRDYISRIVLRWRCTNVTVSAMLDAVLACLTKIELVDGSEILASLTGLELQALNFYNRKVMPLNRISLTVGGFFEAECALDFGRWLWDKRFMLDPNKYKNLQLRVTWDEDACNTGVVVNQLSVFAYVDDAPGALPEGFLSAKEIYSAAMGTSTHVYVDLPTDFPIRSLLVRSWSTDHDPPLCLSNIKIDADSGKAIPYDLPVADLAKIMGDYPELVEHYILDGAVTAKTLYTNLSEGLAISIDYDGTAFVTAQSKFAVPTVTGAKIALAASVDIKALTVALYGRMPHNCMILPFGDYTESEQWLPAKEYKSLKADVTYSGDTDSGDTLMLVTEQVRK